MSPRLLRPRATGFNLRSLAGLFAWYDASTSSSITTQTGVSQWEDLSGNARHLTQSTTNNQPAYGTVTLNGKATITFDGTNDVLRSAAWTLNQPYHTFIIFRHETTFSSATFGIAHNIGAPRSGELSYGTATTLSHFAGASLFRTGVASGSREAFNPYEIEANGASSALRVRTFSNTGNAGTNNSNGLTVGANGNTLPTQHGDMSVAEIAMFSRVLTGGDLTKVRNYLANKWAVSYT
jgi:hypothetical protein